MDSVTFRSKYALRPKLPTKFVSENELWNQSFHQQVWQQLIETRLCRHEQSILRKVTHHLPWPLQLGWAQVGKVLCHSCHHTSLWLGWHIVDETGNLQDCCLWWSSPWGFWLFWTSLSQIYRWRKCNALWIICKSKDLWDPTNQVTGWHIWIRMQCNLS